MNNDLIDILCGIVLFFCTIGAIWSGYLMYLDWLWNKWYKRMLIKGVKQPVTAFEDVSYTEIARFD